MRMSIARPQAADDRGSQSWEERRSGFFGLALRRLTVALSVVLVLGAIGLLFSPAKAGADTVLAPTQVFASVGNSAVNVYSPNAAPAAPSFVQSLNDGSTIPPSSLVYPGYPGAPDNTAGSAFGPASPASSASPAGTNNFYVTDDYSGQISEYSTSGALVGVFASGLQNPLSLVFDNSGNLYVGQQNTPYIAEFNSSGQAQTPIGPVTTGETGDDWIDLASDQCTFYYTTETNVIYRYANNCANGTNGQQSNFNSIPFTGANAFQVRILPDGGALVADSNAVLRLDDTGTVTQIYPCSAADQAALQAAYAPGGPSNPNANSPAPTVEVPLPPMDGSGCGGQLFSLALDPSGTSFWAGDSYSGNIWQIDLATGTALTEVSTGAAFLYGLTVYNGYEAAVTPPPAATPTQLTVAPVTGNFSTPTPVSATLTNASGPVANESVTFTLNGNPNEACTATTNAQGVATCPITASEPSSTYTLSASFAGDTMASTPLGSDSASSTFTENADASSVTVSGPPSVVNGQPITLSGTLTDTTTNTPLGTKEVTFTIGTTGSSLPPQSCNAITDATTGVASCTIQSVDQPASSEPINATFTGDAYDNPSTSPPSTVTVTEPTILTVSTATSDYSDQTTVSAVLTDGNTNAPIGNEPVVFTLNGTETCTGTTTANSTDTVPAGTASCNITPGEQAGTYTLTANFAGDTQLPLQLMPANNTANFVVTLEETELSYTGQTSIINTQNLNVSGVLTSDSGATPVVGRNLTFVLGSGSTAQSCTTATPTTATGTGSCTIDNVNQAVGPVPLTVSFSSDGYYQSVTTPATVNVGPVQVGTTLTVNPATSDYSDATTVSATLIDTYTSAGAANEPVTLTLNGTEQCHGTTNASGVVSCSITPGEPAGTYSLTASFSGDNSQLPHLEASTGQNNFVVTHEETALTYTGATSATNGSPVTLSGVLTTDSGTVPVVGRTVKFTLGSGTAAQTCSGTTNASGAASCVIAKVNQTTSPVPVTDSFAGDAYYAAANATGSVTISTPTTLTVSAGTSTYGQPTTLTGTLTNSVTGAPISGQTITLTLNGTQSCTATTNQNGQGSCSVTPNEPSGTYTASGSFAGGSSSTNLLPSSGCNHVVVKQAPTSLTYTGPTNLSYGQTYTLTSTLTSNGVPIAGQPVVITLGSGRTAQSCTGTTNSSGVATCGVTVTQVEGNVTITVSYAGNSYYQSSSASSTERITCGGGGGRGGSGGGGSGGPGGGGQGGGSKPPGGGGCG